MVEAAPLEMVKRDSKNIMRIGLEGFRMNDVVITKRAVQKHSSAYRATANFLIKSSVTRQRSGSLYGGRRDTNQESCLLKAWTVGRGISV